MDIETNGSVVPEDSVAYAARIIDEQLKMFINFDEQIRKKRTSSFLRNLV